MSKSQQEFVLEYEECLNIITMYNKWHWICYGIDNCIQNSCCLFKLYIYIISSLEVYCINNLRFLVLLYAFVIEISYWNLF